MDHQQPQSEFQQMFLHSVEELGKAGVAALTGLYDVAAPRAMRYAQTLLRNQHDSEEVLQATFVQVALNVPLLVRANSPWAYFLRILRNEALKQLSKQSPASSLQLWEENFEEKISVSVDSQSLEAEQKHLVWQALQTLPGTQSEVIVLKIWEEMTFAEIAEVLHLSAPTVASRYRYGLKKLEQILQRHFEEQTLPVDKLL